ncbi:RHS repeat-associated core domain containing protein [Nitzschia inconspicua]|uniref:RHS repeat-associated core domain containing protein n=1 Tax=Nitzschia inconspicua TaxID=303405 RepID=A0A9K3M3V9_9STRA|nr:RHS repeat-associated core domain containing protein [Nitzschia inconspicua]
MEAKEDPKATSQTRHEGLDSSDSDKDDDDGLLKDVFSQMEKNGKTVRNQAVADDYGHGDDSHHPSHSLTCNATLNFRAPGAVRMEVSGARSSPKSAEDILDVSEDLEQPGDSVASVTRTIDLSDFTGQISDADGTGVISADIVDEVQLEAQFRKRIKSEMVEAIEVRKEAEFQQQEAAMAQGQQERREVGRRRSLCVWSIIILAAAVISIVLGVSLGGESNRLSDHAFMEELFFPLSGPDITVKGTPQYQALNWLAYEDPAKLDIQSTSYMNLTQRYVMAVFFYSTGGPTSWVDDLRFLSNYSVCEWPNLMGIKEDARTDNEVGCNEHGEIIKIRVERNNLTGTLPKELSALTTIQILTTGGNPNITGTLPAELGELTFLNFLQFADNSLTGTFPENLRKLTRLETFSIFGNHIRGKLPESFVKDTSYKLEIFDLGRNIFTGTIPNKFNTQSKLRYVFMEDNAFEGDLPSTLYAQPNLQILSLSNNLLNGTIGQQIAAMESLRLLYLDNNAMTGSIPSQLFGLKDLDQIYLSSNKFGGSIPAAISRLSRVRTIDLSNNVFNESLPSEMGLLERLTVLNLEANPELSGTLPESFGQLTQLEKLFLKDTNISGGLNEALCIEDNLITEIQADCAVDEQGILIGTLPCDCCTSCCKTGGSECTTNVTAMCETKVDAFKSASSRGAVCSCSEDGVNATCTDTACESCTIDETICATNNNYGYTLNETAGGILSFQNTISYTAGEWKGTDIFYQSLESGPNCNIWINGKKCRECANIICSSGFTGFHVQCSNIGGVGVFNSCDEGLDVGPLKILHTFDTAQVSGCPVLLERLSNPSGF